VLSLHKLRNDVQHLAVVPSIEEVERHRISSRAFFDEICREVYEGLITFAEISLALFVRCETEKLILSEMERAFQEENFSISSYYARNVIAYHIRLLRQNMKVPVSWHSSYFQFEIGSLGDFVKDTDKMIDWIIDRLILREYYDEVNKVLQPEGTLFGYKIGFEPSNKEQAEEARILAYDFITHTQDAIKKAKDPFVFDFRLIDENETEYAVQIGIASDYKLTEARISLMKTGPSPLSSPSKLMDIPPQIGLQRVNLEKEGIKGVHTLQIYVTSENEGSDVKYLNIK
jgi:hypothetical protein